MVVVAFYFSNKSFRVRVLTTPIPQISDYLPNIFIDQFFTIVLCCHVETKSKCALIIIILYSSDDWGEYKHISV